MLDTAKHTLIDPVIEPIQRAYENPKEFAQRIVDNPLNAWDDVLLPGAMIHGGAKVVEKVTPQKIKDPIIHKVDEVKNAYKDFKKNNEHVLEPYKEEVLPDETSYLESPRQSPSEILYEKISGHESGGDFNAINPDSGARGNIQWMPDTWAAEAERVLGSRTAEMTPENQTIVGKAYIDRLYREFEGDERAVAASIYAGEEYGRQMHQGKFLFDPNVRIDEGGNLSANGKYPSVNEYVEQVMGRKVLEQPQIEPVKSKDIEFTKEPTQEKVVDFNPIKEEHQKSASLENQEANLDTILDRGGLAEKLRSGEIVTEHRTYNQELFDQIQKSSPKERYEIAKEQTLALKEGVADPMGRVVKFEFDETNSEQVKGLVKHLIAGKGKYHPIASRAFATTLIKDTVQTPDVILKQKNGRLAYAAYWRGKNNITHEVIVSMDEKGRGNIVTSYPSLDSGENSNRALNKLSSNIKKADKIIYVSHSIQDNLRGVQSGYPRTPTSTSASPRDTSLPASGNLSIAEEKPIVKSKRENSVPLNMEKEYFSDNASSPYRYVDGAENVTQDSPVSRQELYRLIDEGDVALKHGRIGKKSALGWHNGQTNVIRIRSYGDFETVAHELGHHIDKQFNFSGSQEGIGPSELLMNVNKRFGSSYQHLDNKGQLKEGFAEFFRDYTTNRSRAKTDFPEFYRQFEKKLVTDPVLKEKVDTISRPLHKWYRQAPEDRVKGSISFGEDSMGPAGLFRSLKKGEFGEAGRKIFDSLYTKIVDEIHPLKVLEKEIEKITGKSIRFEESPFMQAWLSRGWVGKAETLLQHGVPEDGVKAFRDILKDIPQSMHKDLSAYMVALRELDIYRWNGSHIGESIQTTLSLKDAMATVEKYKKDIRLVQAQKELVTYQRHLLGILVNEGLITKESYLAMTDKYPNYVPFFREIGDVESGLGGKGFINVKAPLHKMKGSSLDIIDPLESIIKNTFAFTRTIERNRVAQKFVALAEKKGVGGFVEEVTGSASAKDHTFSVFHKGEKKVYSTTPELYQVMKMLDAEGANMITKVLQPFASWLRAGATLTPEFSVSNFTRDTISAAIFSKRGFIPIVDKKQTHS